MVSIILYGSAAVRSRQLHIYRNCKKVLVLAGKSAPKIIREDAICELLQIERIKWMEQRFNNALAAIKDESAASLKAIKEDVAELIWNLLSDYREIQKKKQ